MDESKKLAWWWIVLLLSGHMVPAFAHGGGVDKSGCHMNRKTGDYHCHRSAAPTVPAYATKPNTARDSRTCYTGPRGGRYRIVNGRKRYGC